MSRQANIPYDAQKLDDDIRAIDGDRYNQSAIGQFIMGKGTTYYCNSLKKKKISDDALTRVCKYYKLKKKDYLNPVVEVQEPESVAEESATEVAETQKSSEPPVINVTPEVHVAIPMDDLVAQLVAVNKSLVETIAHQKSQICMLEQVCDKLLGIKKVDDTILSLIQTRENRYNNKNNGIKKFG